MHINLDKLFPAADFHYFREIDSTSSYAQHILAKSQPAEGTSVLADFQTHGRGQYGRIWLSDSTKNLLFSTILYPKFLEIEDQFHLSRCVALGLKNALDAHLNAEKIYLKWPNDIIVEEKKIAGILIQNQLMGSKIQSSIIGIGVNVNQKEFPDEIKACSMANFSNEIPKKEKLFLDIMYSIKVQYERMKSWTGSEEQHKHYNHFLFKKDQTVNIIENGKRKNVLVKAVNKKGQLIIKESIGLRTINFNEIKWML